MTVPKEVKFSFYFFCSRLAAIIPNTTTILAMTTPLTTIQIQVATTTGLLTIIHHPGTTTETDTTGTPDMVETMTVVTMMAIRADTTAAVTEVRTGRASCIGEPRRGTSKF